MNQHFTVLLNKEQIWHPSSIHQFPPWHTCCFTLSLKKSFTKPRACKLKCLTYLPVFGFPVKPLTCSALLLYRNRVLKTSQPLWSRRLHSRPLESAAEWQVTVVARSWHAINPWLDTSLYECDRHESCNTSSVTSWHQLTCHFKTHTLKEGGEKKQESL